MLSVFFFCLYFCYHFYIFFFSKIFFLCVSLVACLSAKSTNSLKESRKGFKFKIEIIKKNDGKQSIKRMGGVYGGWKGAKAQNFQKMRRQKFLFEYSRIILMRGKKERKKKASWQNSRRHLNLRKRGKK